MDYDRVMVLENGKVVEFDAPDALLQQKDSYFRSLALETSSLTSRLQKK